MPDHDVAAVTTGQVPPEPAGAVPDTAAGAGVPAEDVDVPEGLIDEHPANARAATIRTAARSV